MTQNRTDPNTCEVCNQSFNSDRELREHQQTSHSQQRPGQSSPGLETESRTDRGEQRREKIA